MIERRVAVVIEDDDDIRGLMVALLTHSGFEVHEAATGLDGVQAVSTHDPVVVTVDLGLPDIDGFEVARRVRRFTDAYLVMVTGRMDEIDTLMSLDVGADDYLTKPFRPRELRARIEAMLRRPRRSENGMRNDADSAPDSAEPRRVTGGPWGMETHPSLEGSLPPTTSRAPTPTVTAVAADKVSAPDRTQIPAADPVDEADADVHLELDGLHVYLYRYEVFRDGTEIALTPTEFILLRTLLSSGRVVRSKTELSRILRDEEPDSGTFVSESDERSVEVHLGNVRRKLGDDPRQPRWIQTVRGIGYRATGSPQKVR